MQLLLGHTKLESKVRFMDAPDPDRALATVLVKMTRADAPPSDGFLISFNFASSPSAALVGREKIEDHHLKTVTKALSGNLAGERAALLLSVISGFQVMRQMIGLSALADAKEGDLVDLLAGVFDRLIAPAGTSK